MNHIPETRIAGFFEKAYSLLGLSAEAIKELHPDFFPDFTERQKYKDKLFRIPSDFLPFSCLVNKEDLCDAVYAHLDVYREREILKQMIAYCNCKYSHSYLLKAWALHDGTIELKADGAKAFIVISKLYSIPNSVKDL